MPEWWRPVVAEFLRRVGLMQGGGDFVVSSFIRTRAHNAAVGGVPNSQHLLGTAIDLVPNDGDLEGLAMYAQQLGAFGYVTNEGDHVHLQLLPAGVIPEWVYRYVAS